ncbi:MAG: malectin domain-containing carbohydrate-binding protein [Chitinophagaceae bacterium]
MRQDVLLHDGWRTIASDSNRVLPGSFSGENYNDKDWLPVSVPHNWDSYEGYRRLLHGNRHGDAWYRRQLVTRQSKAQKRFFLFFEGVGSYATVFLNGKKIGEHAGGRTTFTIDVTDVIRTDGRTNQLAVRAYHPAGIRDLPWVCGGCSEERGFSEGSQPMGIFRPVHLLVTDDVRIEPFGVHAWSRITDDKQRADLSVNTTLKNYSRRNRTMSIETRLVDAGGRTVMSSVSQLSLKGGDSITVYQKRIAVDKPVLWSPDRPYLYRIVSELREKGVVTDRTETTFGFRTINWKNKTHQFFINGQPVFVNGVAEYEHLIGQSHAFSPQQVRSRMNWVKAAGFNAFRDGHQPHNLLYGPLCDSMGMLWWTQLSAHVWFDTPAFRNNFKQLLREWVIERRNNPSVVLWGLQNESQLPEDFARECTELIRQLDPTASEQRLVTTCNGGSGTDWDVPQNWTGTYGGNPDTYAGDVKKQVLIGEYGAWRTIDLHTEGPFVQNGILSEDRMVQLMEQKIRLAESVKDSSAGQFFWLLTSHDNPGRVQGGEGLRELDRVGPVNYKGLLTPWEEPLDAFYMFRSNYAPKETQPMVYIVSHTWPGRWAEPGIKDSIIVYSNCDEVELFNDMGSQSLGRKKRGGKGTDFQWDDVPVQYNILYAVGYVDGKAVTADTIVLHHLPAAPNFGRLYTGAQPVTRPQKDFHYIYRINCGGPDYIDENGNTWLADRARIYNSIDLPPYTNLFVAGFSSSWTDRYPGMPAFFASQRRTFAPIKGARDWDLFRDFRYGKDQLQYVFPLPDGAYSVELYFVEPWIGIGGGIDGTGMRLFDVAINGRTVLSDLDIWKEAGSNAILKKTVHANIKGGRMIISFPQSRSGQALISAIAIASRNKNIRVAPSPAIVDSLQCADCKEQAWLDIGNRLYHHDSIVFRSLPPHLYGADWLQFSGKTNPAVTSFRVIADADVFVGIDQSAATLPDWLKTYENTQTQAATDENGSKIYTMYRKRFAAGMPVVLGQIGNSRAYPVMILPVMSMQPAYDLKPVTAYRTNVAGFSAGAQKESFGGRECVAVKSPGEVNVTWPVQTGVADIYSITVKYFYPQDKQVHGRVQLIGAGGAMMLDEPVNFTFTRPGKWNAFTVNTRTMINAGHYTVKLVAEGAEGLMLSGIDIQ